MKRTLITLLMLFLLVACGDSPAESTGASANDDATIIPVDPSLFLIEGLVGEITEEACTLSGGTETTCYRFSVTSVPNDHETGPWCPTHISDSAEAGGIWPESGIAYDVDGKFIENMATFYDDEAWQLYNDDGSINVTDSAEACAAAARPDVDEAYQNHCVQCLPEYMDSDALFTYVIPVTPVRQTSPSRVGRLVGVAFNGVNFDGPAPTHAILGAHTLAPFDDCGGHVNLHAGYHYHAHTGCPTEVTQSDTHAPMIGYALDGFPLYAQLDENGAEPTGLDQCRGEYDDVRGYHYHVASAGTNSFISCFNGESGCTFDGDGAGKTCDAEPSWWQKLLPRP